VIIRERERLPCVQPAGRPADFMEEPQLPGTTGAFVDMVTSTPSDGGEPAHRQP
jgi:hypothetical protein